MMTTYRLKFLLLIITCLSFFCSTYCIETSKTVRAVTGTTSILKETPTNKRLQRKIVLAEWEKKYQSFENKDYKDYKGNEYDDKSKKNDENDENDKRDEKNHEKENTDHENDNNDHGKKDDKNDKNSNDDDSHPSNTIVTTIIIVATEAPTNIYTANTNPANQKGGDNQIDDPNSDTPEDEIPLETEIVEQLIQGRNAYHQLVLALSIVGSIGGIALLVGTFILVRMRIRKRKRKEDLEMAQSTTSSPPSSPTPSSPTPSSPTPSSPTPSSSTLSSHTHQPGFSPSLPNVHSSSLLSESGNTTVLNFDNNPFIDPINPGFNQKSENTCNVLPSAPPTLPIHSEPSRYCNYRQNQTLSMVSQTTSSVSPSAPSAKEISSTPKSENPFEDEYGSEQIPLNREELRVTDQRLPISSQSIPSSQHISLSRSIDSFSSDLLPPPAYTPCAPSAPPLYALPTNIRGSVPSQLDEDPLRRHSISSCSVISSIRPLSLRRGSGSLAHISSPFS
ncbi:hypothetical protein BD770DRAFT_399273 [Pilaira anomala]|nr:hypothetical protein BD770DRAFT_399273 [Pilaira anomala]